MNINQEKLKEEISDRLNKSFEELEIELSDMQTQGLLTALDRKKIKIDAEISAKALRDALERTDYPYPLQRELATRLVIQFENSVKDVIAKSKDRSNISKSMKKPEAKTENISYKDKPSIQKQEPNIQNETKSTTLSKSSTEQSPKPKTTLSYFALFFIVILLILLLYLFYSSNRHPNELSDLINFFSTQ